VLFVEPVNVGAFRALAAAPTFHDAVEAADPTSAELLQQLAVEEPEGEPIEVVARLIDEATRRQIARIEAEARQHNTVEHVSRVNAEVSEAKLLIERVREPATRFEAAGQLLGWLLETAEERHD
jgi:hypothetical protein